MSAAAGQGCPSEARAGIDRDVKIPADARDIDAKILEFIRQPDSEADREKIFNDLALEIFAYQFRRNVSYKKFCETRGVTPGAIDTWDDIPAAPAIAFKMAEFRCFPADQSIKIFETSGTTAGKKGSHHFDTLTLYDESTIPQFRRHLLPDDAGLAMRILLPVPEESPASSLVYMCERVSREFSKNTKWYIRRSQLDVDALWKDLADAVDEGEPVFLLGATFSFVHLFDRMIQTGRRFSLPAGSRIMETGGDKGRSRRVSREEFYDLCGRLLGIPEFWVVNEYGMTELTSQLYDNSLRSLRESLSGDGPNLRIKIPPPWMRVRIVDPVTMQPSFSGEPGLIQIWDLANRGSAIAIQTEDIGIREGTGFRVIGRAAGADPRGCSRAIDEILLGNKL